MPDPTCYGAIKFCAIAAARLDADGSPNFGTENLYVSKAGIEIAVSPQVKEGTVIQQESGCGEICVDFQDCDRIPRVNLALQLCQWDYELMELLGMGVLEETAGTPIGFAMPDPNASCPDGVVIEAFAFAWDGDQRALHPISGLPAYHRYRYPKVTWALGDWTNGNSLAILTANGKASPNTNIGSGPFCDWPSTPEGPFAVDLVDSLPTIQCGYQDLVVCP